MSNIIYLAKYIDSTLKIQSKELECLRNVNPPQTYADIAEDEKFAKRYQHLITIDMNLRRVRKAAV